MNTNRGYTNRGYGNSKTLTYKNRKGLFLIIKKENTFKDTVKPMLCNHRKQDL